MLNTIKRFFFILIIFLNVIAAAGELDLSVGGDYRSFPKGGGVNAQLGYGSVIWGNNKNLLYGYTHFKLTVEGVVDYFASTAEVSVFPVTIIGVRAGYGLSQSHLDYEDYDCTVFLCRGGFTESYYEVPLYLAYGRIQLFASVRESHFSADSDLKSNPKSDYIEPNSGLNLSIATSDDVRKIRGGIFIKFMDSWRVGYLDTYVSVPDRGAYSYDRKSHLWLGLLQMQKNISTQSQISIYVGGGEFNSNLLNSSPTFVVGASYSPLATSYR